MSISTLPALAKQLAVQFGDDSSSGQELIDTLKATVFSGAKTEAQFRSMLLICKQYGLNPILKEIYAYPDRNNGVVPVVGVDGWVSLIHRQALLDGIEFNQSESLVEMKGSKPCPEWIECKIFRKDFDHPVVVREYLDEVFRDNAQPWKSHTKRMLRHKALIQCSRVAFGFSGIYDEDEAANIVRDVTPRHYPDDDFQRFLPIWKSRVEEGKNTSQEIITLASSKAALTEEQISIINSWSKQDADTQCNSGDTGVESVEGELLPSERSTDNVGGKPVQDQATTD